MHTNLKENKKKTRSPQRRDQSESDVNGLDLFKADLNELLVHSHHFFVNLSAVSVLVQCCQRDASVNAAQEKTLIKCP